MALLKLSGLVTKISGKLGGSIIGTSENGSYMKQNAFSQQHATAKQDLQRVKIGIVTQFWRSLTGAQQAAYSTETVNYPYVNRVGDTVLYNGYQLFCWMNLNRQTAGYSPKANVGVFVALSIPATTANCFTPFFCGFDYVGMNVNLSFITYGAPYQDKSTLPQPNKYLFLQANDVAVTNATLAVSSNMAALFGLPISGKYVCLAFKVQNVDTGAVTEMQYIPPTLIA